MPHRNTTGNSSPLALCSVIICTQSSHSSAWPSPDSSAACARNASSGGSSAASGVKPRAALTRSSPRGSHELIAVLDARFAALGLLAAVVLDEAARFQHLIHLLVQRQAPALAGEALDEREEPVDG